MHKDYWGGEIGVVPGDRTHCGAGSEDNCWLKHCGRAKQENAILLEVCSTLQSNTKSKAHFLWFI